MSRKEALSLAPDSANENRVLRDEELRDRLSDVKGKLVEIGEIRKRLKEVGSSLVTIAAETGKLVLQKSRILEGLEMAEELGGKSHTLSEKLLLEQLAAIERRERELIEELADARVWSAMKEGWELTIQKSKVLSALEAIGHFGVAA